MISDVRFQFDALTDVRFQFDALTDVRFQFEAFTDVRFRHFIFSSVFLSVHTCFSHHMFTDIMRPGVNIRREQH